MYAYFSLQAAKFIGHVKVYRDKEGKKVLCTAIYNTKEEGEKNYFWKDKRYVEEVEEFIEIEFLINRDLP